MKVRDVVIYNGERFTVPPRIQRIDHKSTHGWQLRYAGTKLYSDGHFGGAGPALKAAVKELSKRMAKLPVSSRLKPAATTTKANQLPVGISGPIVRERSPNRRDCSFSVLLPRYGAPAQRRSVYIAAESTYTVERYQEALAKAVALRQEAEEAYQRAATKATRKQGRELLSV